MCKPFPGVCRGGLCAHEDPEGMNMMSQRESQTFIAAAMYTICKQLVDLLNARTSTIFHQPEEPGILLMQMARRHPG